MESPIVDRSDRVTVVHRPRPDWPCQRVGDLLYGQATVAQPHGGLAEQRGEAWSGTEEEFLELLAMDGRDGRPALAWYEWRAVLADRAEDMGVQL